MACNPVRIIASGVGSDDQAALADAQADAAKQATAQCLTQAGCHYDPHSLKIVSSSVGYAAHTDGKRRVCSLIATADCDGPPPFPDPLPDPWWKKAWDWVTDHAAEVAIGAAAVVVVVTVVVVTKDPAKAEETAEKVKELVGK